MKKKINFKFQCIYMDRGLHARMSLGKVCSQHRILISPDRRHLYRWKPNICVFTKVYFGIPVFPSSPQCCFSRPRSEPVLTQVFAFLATIRWQSQLLLRCSLAVDSHTIWTGSSEPVKDNLLFPVIYVVRAEL